MKRIAKLVEISKSAHITAFHHAVAVTPCSFYGVRMVNIGNLRGQGADGSIKGLSVNAISRLRQAIATTTHKNGLYSLYGVCLTIPWGIAGEVSQEHARRIWCDFVHWAMYDFKRFGIGGIFRVELQKRAATHWHLIIYLSDDLDSQKVLRAFVKLSSRLPKGCAPFVSASHKGRKVISTGRNLAHNYAIHLLRARWAMSCQKIHKQLQAESAPAELLPTPVAGGSCAGNAPSSIRSWEYCCDCFPLNGVQSAIGYLGAHTSKRKQEQLGYKGKQWGFIGRSNLQSDPGVPVASFDSLNNRQRVACFRMLRAWCKRNRPRSAWLAVRPSRLVTPAGIEIFRGLTVRNPRRLYLYGIPSAVFAGFIACALQ